MIHNQQQIKLNGKVLLEKLKVKPPLQQNPVFQDEACFLYFNEGGASIHAPTEKITIQEKESVVLRCGTYFADLLENKLTGDCEVLVIHFYPEILKSAFKNEIPSFITTSKTERFCHSLSKQSVIDHFVQSLNLYFDSPSLADEELLLLKIKELVLLLVQTDAADSVHQLYSQLFNPQQARLVEVIATHQYHNLGIEQLAFLSGMSLSTFKREFNKYYNQTPAAYLRNKKLEKAADLLKHSGFTISEIALEIGYDDPSHFSKLFEKQFNCLPSQFRQKLD